MLIFPLQKKVFKNSSSAAFVGDECLVTRKSEYITQ